MFHVKHPPKQIVKQITKQKKIPIVKCELKGGGGFWDWAEGVFVYKVSYISLYI